MTTAAAAGARRPGGAPFAARHDGGKVNILVLNCGSSSVKCQVWAAEAAAGTEERGRPLARGVVERIGEAALATFQRDGEPASREGGPLPDHDAAVRRIIAWVGSRGLSVGAAGHRVVHGGDRFVRPVVVDDEVLRGIEALEELAPLHNGPSLAGMRAARAALGPGVPMVAVFDTAFHATLPEHARRYAIPEDLAHDLGIRRYGFHGISYRHVLARYCRLAGTPPERATLVALHLGNGASAAAIREGRSVDTSMGFTPLEGLVMGTRSGDLDPAVFAFLARKRGLAPEAVERILNEASGLRGLSGGSHDMRDLLARQAEDPRARLAVEVFCYRARKYAGAYLAALGGAGAVVFTGAIGERAPEVRARICQGMAWCGLRLDPARNEAAVGREAEIGAAGARLRAFVIPTDEERLIAQDTVRCLAEASAGKTGGT